MPLRDDAGSDRGRRRSPLILASICGNKLISPQHVIWLLPLAALASGVTTSGVRTAFPPYWCSWLAMILTQVEYPQMFLYLTA